MINQNRSMPPSERRVIKKIQEEQFSDEYQLQKRVQYLNEQHRNLHNAKNIEPQQNGQTQNIMSEFPNPSILMQNRSLVTHQQTRQQQQQDNHNIFQTQQQQKSSQEQQHYQNISLRKTKISEQQSYFNYKKHVENQYNELITPLNKPLESYDIKFINKFEQEQAELIEFDKTQTSGIGKKQQFQQDLDSYQYIDGIYIKKGKIKVMELYLEKVKVFDERGNSQERMMIFDRNIVSVESKKRISLNKQQQLPMQNEQIDQVKFPKILLNQQIDQDVEDILKGTGKLVQSSMIDAYATYLMQQNAKKYFNLDVQYRESFERLYIFTSEFITNCNLYSTEQDLKKWLYLFLEKLQIFAPIQYQFQIIYSKIVFVINRRNFHWIVAEINLKLQLIIIYDSLGSSHYSELQDFFSYIFSELLKRKIRFQLILFPDFSKQIDGHSCGYFSCIALKYISQSSTRKTFATKVEIKKELQDILL